MTGANNSPDYPHGYPATPHAGQLLHSFNLVEPSSQESLGLRAGPHQESPSPRAAPHEQGSSPRASPYDEGSRPGNASREGGSSPEAGPATSLSDTLHAADLPGSYQPQISLILASQAELSPSHHSPIPAMPLESVSHNHPSHGPPTHHSLSHNQGLPDQVPAHGQQHHQGQSHMQSSSPPTQPVPSSHHTDSQEPEQQLSTLPEVRPVKPDSTLPVKSASSVSQQSILTYGHCIKEFQLKRLGSMRQGHAAADDQAVAADSSRGDQLSGGMPDQATANGLSQPVAPPGVQATGQREAAAMMPAAAVAAAATARAGAPQLWPPVSAEPADMTSSSVDDAPQLPVSAVLQRLHSAAKAAAKPLQLSVHATPETSQIEATAVVEAPELPVDADAAAAQLPQTVATDAGKSPQPSVGATDQPAASAMAEPQQLPAIATAMPAGSPTGALLPGTGVDLLQRPGSSPLPVSKMLRMVSEEQATLLSDLAAQCAAPGGLLGAAPAGLLRAGPSSAEPSNSNDQLFTAGVSAQQPQHAQRSSPAQALPDNVISAAAHPAADVSSTGQYTSTEASAASTGVPEGVERSPLRKRLSQFFSPILGSSSSSSIQAVTEEQHQQQQQQILPTQDEPHSKSQSQQQQQQPVLQSHSQGAQSHSQQHPVVRKAATTGPLTASDGVGALQHASTAEAAMVPPAAVQSLSPRRGPLALVSGRSAVSLQGEAFEPLMLWKHVGDKQAGEAVDCNIPAL